MRLFFALWPDPDMRGRLQRAAERFDFGAGARAVAAENFHLTLAFVGEVPEERLDALRSIGAAQRGAAVTIELDRCELWRQADAAVLEARETPRALAELASCLQLGAGLARVPLRAHVTVARKVAQVAVAQDSRLPVRADEVAGARRPARGRETRGSVGSLQPPLADGHIVQPGALADRRCALGLYSTRHLATTV